MDASTAIPSAEKWRLRASDFELLHEAGALADVRKAELIDGDIYGMSPQLARHSRVKTQLALAIGGTLAEIGGNLQLMIEVSVVVASDNVPEPDIVVSTYKGNGFVPADTVALVVEVSDATLATDLGRKAALYAAAGIPEYWVVDVNKQRVLVHAEPGAEGYGKRAETPFGEPLVSAEIEGLTIETGKLLG